MVMPAPLAIGAALCIALTSTPAAAESLRCEFTTTCLPATGCVERRMKIDVEIDGERATIGEGEQTMEAAVLDGLDAGRMLHSDMPWGMSQLHITPDGQAVTVTHMTEADRTIALRGTCRETS